MWVLSSFCPPFHILPWFVLDSQELSHLAFSLALLEGKFKENRFWIHFWALSGLCHFMGVFQNQFHGVVRISSLQLLPNLASKVWVHAEQFKPSVAKTQTFLSNFSPSFSGWHSIQVWDYLSMLTNNSKISKQILLISAPLVELQIPNDTGRKK